MGLRYKSHPWHGIDIGDKAPNVVNCFIEVVPTDTVKYEIDRITSYNVCYTKLLRQRFYERI